MGGRGIGSGSLETGSFSRKFFREDAEPTKIASLDNLSAAICLSGASRVTIADCGVVVRDDCRGLDLRI